MRIYKRYFLMGILSAVMFGCIFAGAEAVREQYELKRGETEITANGDRLDLEHFAVNGSEYVPVRAFGDALGYHTYWDEQEGSVKIFGGSDFKAAPLGQKDACFQDVYIMMEEAAAAEILGQPLAVDAEEDGSTLWRYEGYTLTFYEGALWQIVVSGPAYATARNIRVGDDIGKALYQYGIGYYFKEIASWYYICYGKGFYSTKLSFYVDENGHISQIKYSLPG